jgi:hypothetical protein
MAEDIPFQCEMAKPMLYALIKLHRPKINLKK